MSSEKPIVVWFKRDLRLTDHEPLAHAIATGRPLILLYLFEPSVLADPHYDERHWRFVWQSLQDLNQQLEPYGGQIHILWQEALPALKALYQEHAFETLYSSEKIGLDITFRRDRRVKVWCQQQGIKKKTPTRLITDETALIRF